MIRVSVGVVSTAATGFSGGWFVLGPAPEFIPTSLTWWTGIGGAIFMLICSFRSHHAPIAAHDIIVSNMRTIAAMPPGEMACVRQESQTVPLPLSLPVSPLA